MTLDRALEQAQANLNRHVEEALASTQQLLERCGGTAEEIEAELAQQRAELAAWRDNALAEIRRGLEHFDLPPEFVKLQ